MSKRYFIRTSPSDLIQEQNRLLKTLLTLQEEGTKTVIHVESPQTSSQSSPLRLEDNLDNLFAFEYEDEIPYIPSTPTGSATLTNVDTNKVMFDETGVERLKKTRKASKEGKRDDYE
jgi:hypothetical protein